MAIPRKTQKTARALLLWCFCFFSAGSFAIEVSDRYRSARNPERKLRRSTNLIVLHTTEAPARSSLNKLSERGEAHYCVTEEGSIYRIVDRDREAFHAGRSMWKGREDVDKFSIGIECVGFHNKPMSSVQLAAIRDLVAELKKMYGISDECVVCHSHVAYGAPNKWQKRRHRGRKRCGMLFAMPSVRRAIGLKAKPAFDSDTRSGRLSVGDDYLHKVLYGKIDTIPVRSHPAKAPPPKNNGGWFSRLVGGKKDDEPKKDVCKPPPKAVVRSLQPKSISELRAQGYEIQGTISRGRTPIKIAGRKWNRADTYYVIKGQVVPGDKVNAAKLAQGVSIWMKK